MKALNLDPECHTAYLSRVATFMGTASKKAREESAKETAGQRDMFWTLGHYAIAYDFSYCGRCGIVDDIDTCCKSNGYEESERVQHRGTKLYKGSV